MGFFRKVLKISKRVWINIDRLSWLGYYGNFYRWRKLKDKYRGERVFLIGNGPSLNETPLYLLKNEYTLSFNRFYLMLERLNWNPSFFMMSDGVVLNDNIAEIMQIIKKTNYSFFPDRYLNFKFTNIFDNIQNVMFFFQEKVPFSKFLPYVVSGDTVACVGFEVLAYLGFSEIYFVGVDMNYVTHNNSVIVSELKDRAVEIESLSDDDPNHFDPRYFGEGKKFHQPDKNVIGNINRSLMKVAHYFHKKSQKVVNVGYHSCVDYFPKGDLMDVLGYKEETIDSLFTDLLNRYGYESINEFENKCLYISDFELWDDNYSHISMSVDMALKIMKQKILDFIPLGPYKGKIFFIKRSILKQ